MLEPTRFKDTSEIKKFLASNWNISAVKSITHIDSGSANLYSISTHVDYILKEYESDVSKENILKEINVVNHLRKKELPVTTYVETIGGDSVLDIEDRYYTLMHKLKGNVLDNNILDDFDILKVSKTLAQINIALEDFEGLPIWERTLDPNNRLRKLDRLINNLQLGNSVKKDEFLVDLNFKRETYTGLIRREIDMNQFTFRNSNGDFSLRQLLFNDHNDIIGILDFDRATRLPIVWEILRSYIQSSVHSKHGDINIDSFVEYVKEYIKYLPLTKYDLENIALLYLLQLTPTTHGYNPENYVLESAKEKTYKFGKWRTAIVRWLSLNENELTQNLLKLI